MRVIYKEQNQIAKECKSNPKKFWNYINSKTKSHNGIGDLLYSNENGEEVIISNDQDKANVLCNYFSSVFNNDLGVVTSPSEFVCSTEMEQVLIDVDDNNSFSALI